MATTARATIDRHLNRHPHPHPRNRSGGLDLAQPDADPRALEPPCTRLDPELFFATDPAGVEHAKGLCATCPIRRSCLAGALARAEFYGVWGGELVVRGEVVARKRGRGRPRKRLDAEQAACA